MIRAAGILAVIFLLWAGDLSAQQRDIDTTDVYYRTLKNYLKFKSGSVNTLRLKTDEVTTRNIPETLDGCRIVKVDRLWEVKGKEFTIFHIEPARWKEGGFEIRVREELVARKKGRKFEVLRWSYFPLRVVWDTTEKRYVLVPEERDINEILGSEIY